MKNKPIAIALLALLMLPSSAKAESSNKNRSVYEQAGIIRIHDPKSVMVGYRNPGQDVFELSLDDIGKYTGHVCAGVASGYLLTAQAMEMLYPEETLPVRGDISMAASEYNDQSEVAAYVIRAREHTGDEKENNTLVIDPALSTTPASVVIIFKRMDNGNMVKAVLDKSRLACSATTGKIVSLKKKVLEGTATPDEKKQFAESVQGIVAKTITDTPDGLITVSQHAGYIFPER